MYLNIICNDSVVHVMAILNRRSFIAWHYHTTTVLYFVQFNNFC